MPSARLPWIVPLVASTLVAIACGGAGDPPATSPTTPAKPKAHDDETPPPGHDDSAHDDHSTPLVLPPPNSDEELQRLNPELAGTGTDALLAAFPERSGSWTRAETRPLPAGMAGRWADGASASYLSGELEARIDVTDMIRVQPCAPGMGESMLTTALAETGTTRVELGAHVAAALTPDPPGAVIVTWLGDRCQLTVRSRNANGSELVSLATGLGLDGLAGTCERRDPTKR